MDWTDLLDVAGMASFVTAGFFAHIVAGFMVLGVVLLVLANLKWGAR